MKFGSRSSEGSIQQRVATNGRAGVNIDGHGTGGGGYTDNRFLIRRVNATELDTFVQDSNLADFTPSDPNAAFLVVGKLEMQSGSDVLEWWINPDVSQGIAGLGTSADASYVRTTQDFDGDDGSDGLQQWSIHLYQGGEIDNLIISNRTTGFQDVTGVASTILDPSTFTVDGDFTMLAGSTLEMEIFNPTLFDDVVVGGDFTAGGTLDVDLAAGAPTLGLGDSFDLFDFDPNSTVSGSFATLDLPSLTAGLVWDTSNLLTTGEITVATPGIPGDFNGDGRVDGLDFLAWQRDTSLGDLSDWEANYGNPVTSNTTTVPEPGAGLLLMVGGALGLVTRRRK